MPAVVSGGWHRRRECRLGASSGHRPRIEYARRRPHRRHPSGTDAGPPPEGCPESRRATTGRTPGIAPGHDREGAREPMPGHDRTDGTDAGPRREERRRQGAGRRAAVPVGYPSEIRSGTGPYGDGPDFPEWTGTPVPGQRDAGGDMMPSRRTVPRPVEQRA
ncbi:hypothetical protein Pen02_65250 [Plantactinospora endophytica]|uniref:Uncharacterized protein n=1 Tax=Plantactinospora endophytica TaxID=673535 RepID=A0ABQ4EA52_9ACTN|nr:hypothetical protein Pen02_65250 [Plantactinospora endophytica]